jgi:hypothetical protein
VTLAQLIKRLFKATRNSQLRLIVLTIISTRLMECVLIAWSKLGQL